MLSVHTSHALRLLGLPSSNLEFSIHSGVEKIVPSATVDVASSPKRIPPLPYTFDVLFTHLSATLPNNGEIVPVTEPRIVPRPVDFKMSSAEYPSFSPVCGLMCPPCSHWLSPSLMPSYVPKFKPPPTEPATTRPANVLPNNRAPTLVAAFFATMRPPTFKAILPPNEPIPPEM